MKLFEPIKLGNVEIKNRIVMPGMETNLGDENGNVTPQIIEYYKHRAKGGTGLIIVEGVFFDKIGRGTLNMLSIESSKQIKGLKQLAEVIHTYGAKVLGQLYHAGIQSTSFLTGEQIVGPSNIPSKVIGVIPQPMTKKMIKDVVKGYAEASARLQKAGFDGVEVHAGHGYLLNQFFSPLFNDRTDEYGGTLENRTRFAVEVSEAIRKKCGENFIICFRLNCEDFIEGGLLVNEMGLIAQKLSQVGANLLNITAGIFDSPYYPVVPFMNRPRGLYSKYSKTIKQFVRRIPICVVGRINTPEIAEEILQDNRADMVAMGRAVIADPYFPQKVLENKRQEMIVCPACNACLNQILIEEKVSCAINPNIFGRYQDIDPTKDACKVLVIGAGPAGLEAALVAKIRGHNVLLIDEQDKMGGNLHLAAIAPMKKETRNFISKYLHLSKKYDLDIRLNTPYSKDILEEFKPDVAILATGSVPSIPNINGIDVENYKTYSEILRDENPSGTKFAVIGGGMIGIEVSNYLSSKNKQITIFEENAVLGTDLYSLVGSEIVQRTLDDDRILVVTDAVIENIDGRIISGKHGSKDFAFVFDEIVVATEPTPYDDLESEIKNFVPLVFKIGDCKKKRVRKIFDAVQDGYEIGMTLETIEPPPMLDEPGLGVGLRASVIHKVNTSTFEIEDIPDYLEVLVDICNSNDKIQSKSKKSVLKFQFKVVPGPSFWINNDKGQFTTGNGELNSPDVTIEMNKNIAAGVFTGEVNAASAYMSKQIKFIGPLRHGMKFQQWVNAVRKELGFEI